MINDKNFMEFFEKEFNVQFIDVKTGKRALEVVAEKEKSTGKSAVSKLNVKKQGQRRLEGGKKQWKKV